MLGFRFKFPGLVYLGVCTGFIRSSKGFVGVERFLEGFLKPSKSCRVWGPGVPEGSNEYSNPL